MSINLEAFPLEVLIIIMEQLVLSIGITKAVRLRSVNKSFNTSILFAICESQVVCIYDQATPHLSKRIPPPLKGRILLTKSLACEATTKLPAVIASVNKALDHLTHPIKEDQIRQHLAIAEAVAGMAWSTYPLSQRRHRDADAETEAQNVLSGAVVLGNLPLIKSLLEGPIPALARANSESPFFGRPLQLAAAWGHLPVVRYLLDCGADPHATSCYSSDPEKLDVEDDLNDDPNSVNEDSDDGWGSDSDYSDDDETTEDDEATEDDIWKWREQVRLLDWYVYRSAAGSALRAAALGGHEDIVRLLLEPQYRISPSKPEYFRAVVAGARGGHIHLCQLLIHTIGKHLSDCPGVGDAMLREGIRHGQKAIVQMLLDDGVNVNGEPYFDGCPPLSIAASQGNGRMVQFLLDRGARTIFKAPWPSSRMSPIQFAARGGHQEVVEILLQHGNHPMTALRCAIRQGQKLRHEFPARIEVLGEAIEIKNPRMISLLVNFGIQLDDLDDEYIQVEPLIVRAKTMAGGCWIADFLLSIGANDEEVDEDERQDNFSEDDFDQAPEIDGVTITRRTWDWIGKY
ncbi:ankyrin [Hypoxylon crocopeplum]|nr:ankyrin [Hypoxylon crocopeplum]